MKATQVTPVREIAKQRCAICGKSIYAPWGRIEDGKWLCSRSCGEAWAAKTKPRVVQTPASTAT